jgi:hypothetical protein
MPLIRRVPWTSQPQYSVRPAQRWIDRGLVFAYHGLSRRSVFTRGGITLGGADERNAGISGRASSLGVGADYDGSTSAARWRVNGSGTTAPFSSRDVTLVSTAVTDSTAVAAERRTLGFAGNNSTLFNLEIYEATARFQVRDILFASLTLNGGTVTTGRAFTLVGRRNGANLALFHDGAVYTSGGGPTGTLDIYGPTVGYLDRSSIEQVWDGWLGDQFIFDKPLTDAECQELQRNPFAVWEPRRIIIPVSTGADGGTAVGLASETDTAFALSGVQRKATGQASETDTALALTGVQRKATGLASETDTALARAGVQIKLTGRADETDTALALLIGGGSSVGLAAETDTALALAGRQIKPAGLAAETDTALTLAGRLIKAAGLAAEADVAFALAGRQIRAVGRASEVDTAVSLLNGAGGSAGMAAETDTAFALPGIQIKLVGRANEVDSAFALYLAGAGPAREYLYLMSAISTSATRTSAITRAVTLQSAIDIESTP